MKRSRTDAGRLRDESLISSQVKDIYEEGGWATEGAVTRDARQFEDLRLAAASYVAACRLRVCRHLPPGGRRLLDMACGPIQYPEYLKYSENFDTRVCVDLSQRALNLARSKLGERGEYHAGDFLELSIEPVDAAVSLHTIYHIHKDRQEAAVRKLIAVTKPGGTIVIIYSNPGYFVSVLLRPLHVLKRLLRGRSKDGTTLETIYFHRHPLSWWRRFEDAGTVAILPWRSLSGREQRIFFPDNALGERMLQALFVMEDRYPAFFAAVGCYPMIVIRRIS